MNWIIIVKGFITLLKTIIAASYIVHTLPICSSRHVLLILIMQILWNIDSYFIMSMLTLVLVAMLVLVNGIISQGIFSLYDQLLIILSTLKLLLTSKASNGIRRVHFILKQSFLSVSYLLLLFHNELLFLKSSHAIIATSSTYCTGVVKVLSALGATVSTF